MSGEPEITVGQMIREHIDDADDRLTLVLFWFGASAAFLFVAMCACILVLAGVL